MMAETDNKAIIVAINTTDNRTSDLFPDITGADNKEKRGREFANFICDTIMPYIQENYNVYTDALSIPIN